MARPNVQHKTPTDVLKQVDQHITNALFELAMIRGAVPVAHDLSDPTAEIVDARSVLRFVALIEHRLREVQEQLEQAQEALGRREPG